MFNDEDSIQEYERAEAELKQHAHEPLNAKLVAYVQSFTLERLVRYMERENIKSKDSLINSILADFLYSVGE